jgi:ATP-binding cassette subfamily B protein
VSFRDVCFAYNGDYPVLSDISFEIKPGARVGIMGMTGGGKSTLVSLLTRFYDPTQGQILLDGVDLRDYKLADLRSQFGIVLQESILFSTSIGENIAYARPGAAEHEIVEAAKAANAHEFITRLPDGYGTMVGERGMQLSGGQRQRIALARAFLKNAPILILDEPTSSIDIKTEREIIQVMERLSIGRTVFIIAHRLSTLKHCDLLLGIEKGRLTFIRSDVSKAIGDPAVFAAPETHTLPRQEKFGA